MERGQKGQGLYGPLVFVGLVLMIVAGWFISDLTLTGKASGGGGDNVLSMSCIISQDCGYGEFCDPFGVCKNCTGLMYNGVCIICNGFPNPLIINFSGAPLCAYCSVPWLVSNSTSVCSPSGQTASIPSCPNGVYIEGECTCINGVWNRGSCYCTSGKVLVNNECVCPANTTLLNGFCTLIPNNPNTYSWCDYAVMNWSSNLSLQNSSTYNRSVWCSTCTTWTGVNLTNSTVNLSAFTWNNLCNVTLPSNQTNQTNQTTQGNLTCGEWLNRYLLHRNNDTRYLNWTYNGTQWCYDCQSFTGGNWSNHSGVNRYYNWTSLCRLPTPICVGGQYINGTCRYPPNNNTNNTNNNNSNGTGGGPDNPINNPPSISTEPGKDCEVVENYWESSSAGKGESTTLTIVGSEGCTFGNELKFIVLDSDFLINDFIYEGEVNFDKEDAGEVYVQVVLELDEETMPDLVYAFDSPLEGNLDLQVTTFVKPVTKSALSQRSRLKTVPVEVASDILDFSYEPSQSFQEEL